VDPSLSLPTRGKHFHAPHVLPLQAKINFLVAIFFKKNKFGGHFIFAIRV
jgi:hypothetical protein